MNKRSSISENWYQTLSGRSSLDHVDDLCTDMLSEIFGYNALEMGLISEHRSLLTHSRITTGFTLCDSKDGGEVEKQTFGFLDSSPKLIGATESLPIATDNIDLVIASHTLELSSDPHQVLREIDRVLVPEGHCILIGFNPLSISQSISRIGEFIKARINRNYNDYKTQSVARVRDWFSLLGFDVVDVHYVGMRPAIKNKKLFDALAWMEYLGDYAGGLLGNMYVVHAKKQVVAMRPDTKVWRAPAVLSGGKVVLNNAAQKIRRQNFSNL